METISRNMVKRLNQDDICTIQLKDGTVYQVDDNPQTSSYQRNTYNQEVIEERDNYKFVCSGGEGETNKPCTCQTQTCNCPCHQSYEPPKYAEPAVPVNTHTCPYCENRKKPEQLKPATTLRSTAAQNHCPFCHKEKKMTNTSTTLRVTPIQVIPRSVECPMCQNQNSSQRQMEQVCPTCHQRTQSTSSTNVLRSRSKPRNSSTGQRPTFTRTLDDTGSERYIYTQTVQQPKRKAGLQYVNCGNNNMTTTFRSQRPQPQRQNKRTTCPICQGNNCPVCGGQRNSVSEVDNYKFTEIRGTCPPKRRSVH